MSSNLALNRCGTVESKMPIQITIFLLIHHDKISSLAECKGSKATVITGL